MDQESLFALHRKYAPNEAILNLVWEHSVIVATMADQLLMQHGEFGMDRQLILDGALLHDIGVYTIPFTLRDDRAFWDADEYILHGVRGADILEREGYNHELIDIVKRHIGVGIEKGEIIARNLPLPRQNFIPETLEEKLVAYADNFHSKVPKFNTYEEVQAKLRQFGEEKVLRLAQFRDLFGVPHLTNTNL